MLKKLTIIVISTFLLSWSANAGSDGDLTLKNESQTNQISSDNNTSKEAELEGKTENL